MPVFPTLHDMSHASEIGLLQMFVSKHCSVWKPKVRSKHKVHLQNFTVKRSETRNEKDHLTIR